MQRRGRANETSGAQAEEPLDEELTALRAVHDPAAFAPLYRRYLPEILALCSRRLGNRLDAEDATAEVFRKALAKRGTFRGGSFRKWIYTIAINTLRDLAARQTPPTELFATFADPTPGPEELALRTVGADDVIAALAQLPDDWQLVVELRSQGYRCGEVAAAVGRDADWVRLTHHRAMVRLARALGIARPRRVRHG